MNLPRTCRYLFAVLALTLATPLLRADPSFAETARKVNEKVVKLFGAGGFQGLADYGSGILVSEDGYILTVASHMLDTQDLRVHLADGRRYSQGKVVAIEPVLDVALVKIDGVHGLEFFDVLEAARQPLANPGTGVLAFSNQFKIAERDEAATVQRGVIAAYTKLLGYRGVFDAPYTGDVYFVDAIMCNPGAAGGALTTRKGRLLGIIGKEMRNQLTGTWINYGIPIQATARGRRVNKEGKEEEVDVSIVQMIDTVVVKKGIYTPTKAREKNEGPKGYHGIVLVPDVLDRTPPYVEEVERDSPASKGGLRPDDLIVYVDGYQVVSIKAFREIVNNVQPGQEVTLEVQRGNKLETVKLILAKPRDSKTP